MCALHLTVLLIDVYLNLVNRIVVFQDPKKGIGITRAGRAYNAVLTDDDKLALIHGVVDTYKHTVKYRLRLK
jgi:hypothetical protein